MGCDPASQNVVIEKSGHLGFQICGITHVGVNTGFPVLNVIRNPFRVGYYLGFAQMHARHDGDMPARRATRL